MSNEIRIVALSIKTKGLLYFFACAEFNDKYHNEDFWAACFFAFVGKLQHGEVCA
jgi:hypothetical protein